MSAAAPQFTSPADPDLPTTFVLAGWWSRVGAWLLDLLIVATVALVPGAIGALLGSHGDLDPAETGVTVWYIALWVLWVIYQPLLLARKGMGNGSTPGKRALEIRVVRGDGTRMSGGSAAMRELVGRTLLGLIPLYGLIDIFAPLGDAHNRAIHDRVGKTVVVRAEGIIDSPGLA